MASTDLRFVLRADSREGIAAINQFTQTLKASGAQSNQVTEEGKKGFAGLGSSVITAGAVVKTLGTIFAATKIVGFLKESMDASQQLQTSFLGLGAVSRNLGIDVDKSRAAAVALTKDGFLNLSDASRGLQNLLASGLNLPFATQLMNKNKDAAIFNRQSHLQLSESIRVFTEGFKNEISTLTDATGVSTNYARSLETTFKLIKAGHFDFNKYRDVLDATEIATIKKTVATTKSADALDKQSKSIVAGLGFLKELELFEGNAAKGADLLAVKQQKLENQMLILKGAIGDAMLPAMESLISAFSDAVGAVDTAGGSLQFLASAFAFPLKAAFSLIAAFSKAGEGVLWMALQISKGALALAQIGDFMNPFIEKQAPKFQAAVDQMSLQLTNVKANTEKWNVRIGELDRSVEKFGTVTLADSAKAHKAQEKVINDNSEAVDKNKKKIDALKDAHEKLQDPSKSLTKDLEALGLTMETAGNFVQDYGEETFKAASITRQHGKDVDDAAKIVEGYYIIAQLARIAQKALNEEVSLAANKFAQMGQAIASVPINHIVAGWSAIRDGIDLSKNSAVSFGHEVIEGSNKAAAASMEAGKKWGDHWKNQVSTIVTDLGKGIADAIIKWKGFGASMIDIGKQFVSSLLRIFMEGLFGPILAGFSSLLGGGGFGKGVQGAGGLLGGIGGLGGLFGGGAEAGGGGLGGLLGGAGGGIGGLLGLGGGAGGTFGGIAGFGATGGLEAGGAGPGSGLMGGLMSGLSAVPLWGWIAMAGITAGVIFWKKFTNSVSESAKEEAWRDFKVALPEDQFKAFLQQLSLTEKAAAGIRKDLESSPKFLTEVLYPLAQAQGKVGEFLGSLEHVTTAWGDFNFRAAFEIGLATGDWTELNTQFVAAFGNSVALRDIMPDWATKLMAVSTAAKDAGDSLELMGDRGATATSAGESFLGLLEALNKLRGRPAEFATEMETLAGMLTFLQSQNATTAEIMALLGDGLKYAQSEADKLGVTLPPVIQQFLDLANALVKVSDVGPPTFRETAEAINGVTDSANRAMSAISGMNNAAGVSTSGPGGTPARARTAIDEYTENLGQPRNDTYNPGDTSLPDWMARQVRLPGSSPSGAGPTGATPAGGISTSRAASTAGNTTIVFEGNVYGLPDFQDAVAAAVLTSRRRGGLTVN